MSISEDIAAAPSHDHKNKKHQGRNIILLLDGTNNQFGNHNTNLIKTLGIIKSDEEQFVYYSSGVGTILPDSSNAWGKLRQWGAKIVDLGLAVNFKSFVLDAYRYLMDTYKEGDRVFIFGFSRGSYTARALAGMIQKVGLLPPRNYNQVALAYGIYTQVDRDATSGDHREKAEAAKLYRRIFGVSRRVNVEFVGVWDTVSSLGGIGLPRLPFAAGVHSVRFFRHAMALDERRARFICEYRRQDQAEIDYQAQIDGKKTHISSIEFQIAKLENDLEHNNKSDRVRVEAEIENLKRMKEDEEKELEKAEKDLEILFPDCAEPESPVLKGTMVKRGKEVWFMGCHSDVGGGNDLNNTPSLSNITFRWMMREAASVGLLFSPAGIALQPALNPPELLRPDSSILPIMKRLESLRIALDAEDTPIPGKKEESTKKKLELTIDSFANEELIEVIKSAAALDSRPLEHPHIIYNQQGFPIDAPPVDVKDSQAVERRNGLRVCIDVFQYFHESLKGVWWILEWLPLLTRQYRKDGPVDHDIWEIHVGRGRQMIPHQNIHRSVSNRLNHEYLVVQNGQGKKTYWTPAAKPALGQPSWDQVRKGEADSLTEIWEV